MRLAIGMGWLLAAMMVCTTSASATEGWRSDFESARQEAIRTGKPLLVHFGATWCGPCRQMESTVFNQPTIVKTLHDDVVAVKLDIDQNKELGSRFGIEMLPSDILLAPNGERLVESSGFRNEREYAELLNRGQTRNRELAKKGLLNAKDQPSPAVAQGEGLATKISDPQAAPMLDGYCPVTLWNSRKWIKGSSEFAVEFRGQVYHLSSAEAYDSFRQDPRRYTPRFLGCDPVVVWESDRAIRGLTKFAAFYDDELYLFSNADNRDRFKKEPDQFIRTRIVLLPGEIETVVR
ncbi:MAG: thioredoxin domain-containing protein [Planctomycetaceae bacterium]